MDKLLVIADDFTGALDTGVQFAKLGAPTQLIANYVPNTTEVKKEISVLIVNAQSRHLAQSEAYKLIYQVISEFGSTFNFIYKKTDSALRGNIGSELAAAIDASGYKNVKFFPAFPCMGRTTEDGIHYIDGNPVSESEFGKDLFNPVQESNISKLIGMQTSKKVKVVASSIASHAVLSFNDAEIFVFDSKTNSDMSLFAKQIGKENLHLCAGCAGFASVLAQVLDLGYTSSPKFRLSYGLFVVCGSINPVSLKQLDVANKAGYERISLTIEEKSNPMLFEMPQYDKFIQNCIDSTIKTGCCIVDVDEKDNVKENKRYMKEHNISKAYLKESIATSLGIVFKRVLEFGLESTFMCIGGDTLQAVVSAIGVNDFRPICELAPGVVLSSFYYKGKVRSVVCKSGGFGTQDLICNLVEMCKRES